MTSCIKCLNGALARQSPGAPTGSGCGDCAGVGEDYILVRPTSTPRRKRSSATEMIVNLNRHRKQRQRAETEARAAENRIRFGRSKEQRSKELRESERARKEIEDKRLD
jgi:hypothetical protein